MPGRRILLEIVVLLSVIALTLVLGFLADRRVELTLAFIAVVTSILSAFAVYWWSHTSYVLDRLTAEVTRLDGTLDQRVKELHGEIEALRGSMFFLVDDEKLAVIESKADEVWVMSPDLFYESADPLWQDTVYKNIARGARYRYVLQDSPTMEQSFQGFIADLSRYLAREGKSMGADQVSCWLARSVAPTELVFYDPGSGRPQGFVVAPVTGSRTNMRMVDSRVRERATTWLREQMDTGRRIL